MNGEHLAGYKFSKYDTIDVGYCRQMGRNAQQQAGKVPWEVQPARVPELIFKGCTNRVPEETIVWGPRPPAPEPEGSPRSEEEPLDEDTLARPFNDEASRSHDDDDAPRALRHGEDDHYGEDEEENDDGSMDDDVHDPDEQDRREVQLRGILHAIAIEANNMEYALWREHHGRTIPLQRIIELVYALHAPSIPPPGTYMDEMMGVSTLQGRPQHFLQGHSRRYGDTERRSSSSNLSMLSIDSATSGSTSPIPQLQDRTSPKFQTGRRRI